MNGQGSRLEEQIWLLVAAIPAGRVATYGQLAGLAGYPGCARQVGSVLKHLPAGSTLPWFRVVRSSGELAFSPNSGAWRRQSTLLAAEGITFRKTRVPLREYLWQP